MQLEKEMNKIGLGPEAQMQMRKMLSQKESNYIRLKRAKMDKSMFVRIKPIGKSRYKNYFQQDKQKMRMDEKEYKKLLMVNFATFAKSPPF